MTEEATSVHDRVDLLDGDVHTLAKLTITHRKALTDGDIRAASAILRRWICEGMIGRLCNDAGIEVSFPILDNSQVFEALATARDVNYFLTGGVMFNGVPLMGFYNSTAPPGDGPSIPIGQFPEAFLSFGRFKRQKRVWFEGEAFSCEQIITFVANKLGGVHYDGRRDTQQQQMERAAQFITFGGPPDRLARQPPGKMHFVVEPESGEALSGFHVEIIAAAASFIGMHIDGKPLINLERKATLADRIAKIFSRRRRISLLDFAVNKK